jgi:hypothetical protein
MKSLLLQTWLTVCGMALCVTSAMGAGDNEIPVELRGVREDIATALAQYGRFLDESIVLRAKVELEKPFAVGGKSMGMLATANDLNSGWEIFLEQGAVRALLYFSEGDAQTGAADHITVTVTISGAERQYRSLAVHIRPRGQLMSPADLQQLDVTEKILRQMTEPSGQPKHGAD